MSIIIIHIHEYGGFIECIGKEKTKASFKKSPNPVVVEFNRNQGKTKKPFISRGSVGSIHISRDDEILQLIKLNPPNSYLINI